jgi:hypothetical protein
VCSVSYVYLHLREVFLPDSRRKERRVPVGTQVMSNTEAGKKSPAQREGCLWPTTASLLLDVS